MSIRTLTKLRRRDLLGLLIGGFSAPTKSAIEYQRLRYFPAGPIYEYRWELLALALARTQLPNDLMPKLEPYDESRQPEQRRAELLLQEGRIDVLALGTNAEREANLLPIRIDILRGIIGYRVLFIRAGNRERIARIRAKELRKELLFGLNSQWADLPIMRENGFQVEAATGYESLFAMLESGRFDAFPRGLNEAERELKERQASYPQLVIEKTKALYIPYPVYFWVRKDSRALADRIQRGLRAALSDGSFRQLFIRHHEQEINELKQHPRQVVYLKNKLLVAGVEAPDTTWWWPR